MDVHSLTHIAGLIGEAKRVQMLVVMMDGRSHTASELAMTASVSAQAASAHLAKLVGGGLIVCEQIGRQRLFRLKNSDVAAAIEALGALAHKSGKVDIPEIRFARTCYDHLAGVLAIALRDRLLDLGALGHKKNQFAVTPAGEKLLSSLDIDVTALRGARRAFAHKCLDWTEKHHHIGGALGAALLSRFLENRWLARIRDTRAVRLTHAGERELGRILGIQRGNLA